MSADEAFASESDLLNQLKQLLIRYGDHIALYYEDLETGRKIEFDSNRLFHPASVIKVPYMLSRPSKFLKVSQKSFSSSTRHRCGKIEIYK